MLELRKKKHLLKLALCGWAAGWLLCGCAERKSELVPFSGAAPYASACPIWVPRANGAYEVNRRIIGQISLEAIRARANEGLAAAQRDLGLAYLKGELGLQTDQAEAFKWIEAAARQGDAIGERVLGSLYSFGTGVQPDPVQAVKWYRKAAEQGNPEAQVNLAELLQRGRGTTPNPSEAFVWLQQAASRGNPGGERLLARAYWEGEGTPRSYGRAYWWLHKAAQHDPGNADVQTAIWWIDTGIVCVSVVLLAVVYFVIRRIGRGVRRRNGEGIATSHGP